MKKYKLVLVVVIFVLVLSACGGQAGATFEPGFVESSEPSVDSSGVESVDSDDLAVKEVDTDETVLEDVTGIETAV